MSMYGAFRGYHYLFQDYRCKETGLYDIDHFHLLGWYAFSKLEQMCLVNYIVISFKGWIFLHILIILAKILVKQKLLYGLVLDSKKGFHFWEEIHPLTFIVFVCLTLKTPPKPIT